MKAEEFLNKVPDSNVEWAAQQIYNHFSSKGIIILSDNLKKLDKALYKSWAKEMTFSELMEAITILEILKP